MPRGLDHIVIAAQDLDALAELYRRLGFTVGARNVHPWGTHNNIVQFPGCFLELVTTGPEFVRPAPHAPEAGFALGVADYLERREGLAMLVLESRDAAADHEEFKTKGIGRGELFRFGRKGRRPDGTEVELAFSIAFAASPLGSQHGFFVCQQHFPENFWNPSFQQHDNAVMGLEAIVIQAADPPALMSFLQTISGAGSSRQVTAGRAIDTGRGRIEVLTEAGVRGLVGNAGQAADDRLTFVALRFASRDLAQTRAALEAGRVPFLELHGRLVVGAEAAIGAALVFEQSRSAGAMSRSDPAKSL